MFRPYAGVSTAILIFTRGGATKNVWFYDVQADGYSLDDKRTALLTDELMGPAPNRKLNEEEHLKNNLPDLLMRWHRRSLDEKKRKRTDQSFFVSKKEIVDQGYDLILSRYKKVVHKNSQTDSPQEIITALKLIEEDIKCGIKELERLL